MSVRAQIDDPELKKEQLRVASAIEGGHFDNDKVVLYSLYPDTQNDDAVGFHGYAIRSKGEITARADKTALLNAFVRGVRENDYGGGRCFNPRHGLRIVTPSNSIDFVVCFECQQVYAYGLGDAKYFCTTASPQATFDELLQRYCPIYIKWVIVGGVVVAVGLLYFVINRARVQRSV